MSLAPASPAATRRRGGRVAGPDPASSSARPRAPRASNRPGWVYLRGGEHAAHAAGSSTISPCAQEPAAAAVAAAGTKAGLLLAAVEHAANCIAVAQCGAVHDRCRGAPPARRGRGMRRPWRLQKKQLWPCACLHVHMYVCMRVHTAPQKRCRRPCFGGFARPRPAASAARMHTPHLASAYAIAAMATSHSPSCPAPRSSTRAPACRSASVASFWSTRAHRACGKGEGDGKGASEGGREGGRPRCSSPQTTHELMQGQRRGPARPAALTAVHQLDEPAWVVGGGRQPEPSVL